MTRQNFLKNISLLGLGSTALPLNSCNWMIKEHRIKSIGLGLFSVPKLLEENLEKGIQALADLGVSEFETYGPYDFSDQRNKDSWKAVTPRLGFSASGLYGKSPKEFKAILSLSGIKVPAMHTDLYTLEDHMGPLAEAANELGATYVILPSIPDHERTQTQDFLLMAERFNRIGESAKQKGIKFAYHNHGYGLTPDAAGIVPIQLIFDHTDPELVYFEMDLFWTVAGRANPIELLTQQSGRYKMLHIKDMRELSYFSHDGSTPDQWMELFPQLVAAGEGVMDLPEIIRTASDHGVDHFFIEHDFAPDPIANIGSAANFLKDLSW